MKLACLASAFVVAVGFIAGCSGGGTGDTEYVIRDGKAYCIFTDSEREFAVGVIEGDQVKLYATYGGQTVPASDVEARILAIEVEENEDHDTQQRRIVTVLAPPTAAN